MAAQTYQLVVTGNLAGQFVQNVFHYRFDDASFPTKLAAAKGLIDGWLAADKHEDFLDMLCTSYIFKSVKARCVTGGGGPEWISTANDGDPGTRSGTCSASSAGPIILWFTDGGNRTTGKTFLPGISAADVLNGEILVAAGTAIIAAANSFRATFNTANGFSIAVVQCIPKRTNLSLRALVQQAWLSKYVGQQRRRQLPV